MKIRGLREAGLRGGGLRALHAGGAVRLQPGASQPVDDPRGTPSPLSLMYCSFRQPVRYDLSNRGLVVVTGQVAGTTETGIESNGAGKTALVMAPLWALTGSVDSRAEVRRPGRGACLLAGSATRLPTPPHLHQTLAARLLPPHTHITLPSVQHCRAAARRGRCWLTS